MNSEIIKSVKRSFAFFFACSSIRYEKLCGILNKQLEPMKEFQCNHYVPLPTK